MNSIQFRRMTHILAAGWLALCVLPGLCGAQINDFKDPFSGRINADGPAQPKFTTTITPETAAPGDVVTLSISVTLPKGYYIYSTTGAFGGRTKIAVKPVGLEAVDEEFLSDRDPNVVFEPSFKMEVGKFFDSVTWTRKYRVTADAGAATISGKLTGQYCSGPEANTQQCVPITPPYEFDAAVQVSGGAAEEDAEEKVVRSYSQHEQPLRMEKGEEKPAPIAFDFELSPPDAKPGEKVTFSIKATLQPGWHTFSLTQSGLGGLPTEIDVSQIDGLRPLGEGFLADPPFEVEEQAGLSLEVHNLEVTWRREFEVLPDVKPGNYSVGGEIAYQVCKNSCLPRTRVKFELPIKIKTTPATSTTTEILSHSDVPSPVNDDGSEPIQPSGKLNGGPPKALLPFLLLCFGGGFVALLTPCSFPMVPITVSFFLKQSESQHKRTWLLALVYCGTIVAAFAILGVGIAFVYGAAKLTELANLPWLNIVIGTVFVLFALNMLGVFEIQMPGWLLTMTASQESAGSYLGAIFMALTFTLTSFTCTFAIAGSLLVGASQGDVYWPVIGMMAFGTAFAAPFFVLAMIPSLLKKLPKSGGWMNSVKVVMGLLELGAAVKFFSIADPRQILLNQVVVMTVWTVLAMVTAAYLFGWFRLTHDTMTQQISPWRMLLGTTCFVLAGLLLVGMAIPDRGGVAVRQILAFAPLQIEAGQGALGPSLKHHGLEFALYFDKAVPVAQRLNRPLLLDFTGVNCTNCRNMELKMGQAAWKERLAKFVGVQLYVDIPEIPTIHDPAEGERLHEANKALELELVRDNSMPVYAVVAPDGKTVLARYYGDETIPGTFVKFLDDGWAKWEQLQAGTVGRGSAPIRLAHEK